MSESLLLIHHTANLHRAVTPWAHHGASFQLPAKVMGGPRARRGFDNHSRDAFAKYLADEDENDFIHQAKRQRVVVGYASA
eukprot:scaffold20123_cov82-Skeletonema_menzelii.AAC.1